MKIRKAIYQDLIAIVQLLAQDKLGQTREAPQLPLSDVYEKAFQNIQADPNQNLMVVENEAGEIIGTFQLSFIQYLTYKGGIRAQIEAVRIRSDQRGKNLGSQMMQWAIKKAEAQGAHLIQLTTDKKRPEALAFYEKLGFKASHEGMKLHFKP